MPKKRRGLSKRMRFRVLERDGFRCVYCGRAAIAGALLDVDHIVPVARGGTDSITNLLTACEGCNAGKGAHDTRLSFEMKLAIIKQDRDLMMTPEVLFGDGPLGFELGLELVRRNREGRVRPGG